jgi:uncharacterized PurR-regulated membrane protein YhhQ (DUF165 family)
LSAIVLANLAANTLGASYTPIIGFILIGFDLVARDHLHEQWENHLRRNMLLLIATGSVVTIVVNVGATQIAIASCVAFTLAALVDTVVYQLFLRQHRLAKINLSNAASALTDSFIFPTLAFGLPILWGVVVGQFIAKALGGFLWSIVLGRRAW